MPATIADPCRHGITPIVDCQTCGLAERQADRRNAIHDGHPLNRTRSQVLAQRRNAVAGGCCQRFADQQGCDCLENARADPEPARRVQRSPKLTGNKATILLAMAELGETVGRTAMIVAAWKMDPLAFGLAGAEREFPDSRTIDNALYGPVGLLTRGYLIPSGECAWQLSAKALAEVRRLRAALARKGI